MYKIIDGKTIASNMKEELKIEVTEMKAKGYQPCLAVIVVGSDKASAVYVRNKQNACEYIGIESRSFSLDEDTTEEMLLSIIQELNEDKSVHGILIQLPLPKQIDESKVLNAIVAEKDVDGFHPTNVGKLCTGQKELVSCTPAGIIELLKRSDVEIAGKDCVVVGRSNIVGKPMALLLLEENATVTVAHSRTANLKEVTKRADILIVAIGKQQFITADYVKEGATVIDVGIHRDVNNKLCGDVNYEEVSKLTSAITPVPGGVGPMTIVMLMKNCVQASKVAYLTEDSLQ